MKTLLLHHLYRLRVFLAAALAVVVGIAVAACSDSEDATLPQEQRYLQVYFTIGLNDASMGTRAQTRAGNEGIPNDPKDDKHGTWDPIDTAEVANSLENRIDVSRMHAVFYDKDGGYISQVQNLTLTTTDKDNVYDVFGIMAVPVSGNATSYTFDGKVIVYANVDDNSFEDSLQKVANDLTYSYTPTTADGNTLKEKNGLSAIPMWGVKDFSSDPKVLNQGERVDLGQIDMLRAMAKVSVHLTDSMRKQGYYFTSVSLDRYNDCGLVAPNVLNVNNDLNITNTKALTYLQSFHLPSSLSTVSPDGGLSFLNAAGDTTSLTLYIPEYQNFSGA